MGAEKLPRCSNLVLPTSDYQVVLVMSYSHKKHWNRFDGCGQGLVSLRLHFNSSTAYKITCKADTGIYMMECFIKNVKNTFSRPSKARNWSQSEVGKNLKNDE